MDTTRVAVTNTFGMELIGIAEVEMINISRMQILKDTLMSEMVNTIRMKVLKDTFTSFETVNDKVTVVGQTIKVEDSVARMAKICGSLYYGDYGGLCYRSTWLGLRSCCLILYS